QAGLHLGARREHKRLLVGGAHGHECDMTGRGGEAATDRDLVEDRLAGPPSGYRQRVSATGRHWRPSVAGDRGPPVAVLEPRLDSPTHRHAPRQALHLSSNLAI